MARQRSAARIMAPNMSLRHGLLAEGVGDDLEPRSRPRSRRSPALLDEGGLVEALEPEVRGGRMTRRAAVGDRHAQVRDAGLEVVPEAGGRAGQLGLVIGEVAGDGRHLGATGGAALSMTLVRNAGWGEFVEPDLGRFGDAGEDMQLVRRVFEKKLRPASAPAVPRCVAEMLLGAGY